MYVLQRKHAKIIFKKIMRNVENVWTNFNFWRVLAWAPFTFLVQILELILQNLFCHNLSIFKINVCYLEPYLVHTYKIVS